MASTVEGLYPNHNLTTEEKYVLTGYGVIYKK